MSLEDLQQSLKSLRAARTSLKRALTTRGLPKSRDRWATYWKLDDTIKELAAALHEARQARLEGRAA